MFGVYLTGMRELVIEIAVPGRGGEDLDVRVSDDGETVQIVMPPKASIPGSLLAVTIDAPITGLDEHWSIHEMRATCSNGLLTLIFPMRPESAAETRSGATGRHPVPKIDPWAIFKNRIGRCS